MTKVSKVYQIMFFILLLLFFVEVVMLFSQIDLIPFVIIGFVCGLSIILRNSSEDFFNNENIIKDTKLVLRVISLSVIDILLFASFFVLGIENIANCVVTLLHTSKLIRFAIYGFIFPLITSYFMTWFWTDNKPNLSIFYAVVMPNTMGSFYRILFFNLLVGIGVCVLWVDYFNIVNMLLKFF